MRRFLVLLVAFVFAGLSQASSQDLCPIPDRLFAHKEFSIFNEEQEAILGDVEDSLYRRSIQLADPSFNDYLQRIGGRLVAQLPPTKLKFIFRVVDSGDWNAFTTAGGRVYVTRKLILTAKDEDELATVLSHELGHTLLRHQSAEYTRLLHIILGVDSVGDRKDIEEKIHRLRENYARKWKELDKLKINTDENQRDSDLLGIFISARAGYRPEAFGEFWNRILELKGKTGGGWSDFFGRTTPDQKRLRGMVKTVQQLPDVCRSLPVADRSGFSAWQKQVLENEKVAKAHDSESPGLHLQALLRADLNFLRYSPDGKYLLAQDESGITVLERAPLKVMFRIEAEDGQPAHFSPDSLAVVFANDEQRIERWNILDRRREFAREVWLGNCAMSHVSQDGRFFACMQRSGRIRLGSTETGAVLYESKESSLGIYQYIAAILHGYSAVASIRFTEDAHYMLYRFGDERKLIDLATFQPVKMQGDVNRLTAYSFDFQGSNRLIGVDPIDPSKSGVLEFPSGKKLFPIKMGYQDVFAPTRGDWVLIGPAKKFALALMNTKDGQFALGTKTPAIDVYEDEFVNERKTGELGRYHIGNKQIEQLEVATLPVNDFSRFRTVAYSPDNRYLALSTRSRGAVWDAVTGERIFFLHSFDTAAFVGDHLFVSLMMDPEELRAPDGDASATADGAKKKEDKPQKKRVVFHAHLPSRQVQEIVTVEDPETRIAGEQLLTLSDTDKKDSSKGSDLSVRKLGTATILWSRHFQKDRPGLFTNPAAGTVGLVWSLVSDQTKLEVLGKPQAFQKFQAIKNKQFSDFLVEVVDLRTGQLLATVVIESGAGSFFIRDLIATRQHLVVGVNGNRVLTYSLESGEIVNRTFGELMYVDHAKNQVYLRSDRNRLAIFDLNSSKTLYEHDFAHPIVSLRPIYGSPGLSVVTGDQTVHRIGAESQTAAIK